MDLGVRLKQIVVAAAEKAVTALAAAVRVIARQEVTRGRMRIEKRAAIDPKNARFLVAPPIYTLVPPMLKKSDVIRILF